MIASVCLAHDRAFDIGDDVIEYWHAESGDSVCDTLKLVATAAGETPAQIQLVMGKHIDAEIPARTNFRPTRRTAIRKKRDKRRI